MILIELGRIVYAVPITITWLNHKEDSTVEKISDISEVISNFFWIGLAINISGHFSFFKTQLALKTDPVGFEAISAADNNF